MLKRLEVQNFRGFRWNLVFDMTAGSYEFNQAVVYNGLVKNAIIYGKNGTGKSSLGAALFDIVGTLTDKHRMPDVYLYPYTNMYNSSDEAKFKYVFLLDGKEVTYSYSKRSPVEIVSERLDVDGETVIDFERRENGKRFVKKEIVGGLNLDIDDDALSVVKYIRRNIPSNQLDTSIVRLVDFVDHMLWYRSLSDGNNYAGYKAGSEKINEAIYKAGKLPELQAFLAKQGLKYQLYFDESDPDHTIYIRFPDGRRAEFYRIISTGTRALTLFFHWSALAFNDVSFLFIDEFDAFFHYEAAEEIVRYLNMNVRSQAVVTSHNTYLMKNDLTRPDCCYIMHLDGITPLCKATDRIIREAHNLEKMYVNGVFVP